MNNIIARLFKVLAVMALLAIPASAATTINIVSNVNDVTLTINGMSHMVVSGSQFTHPNTAGSIPYSISKSGYVTQTGNVTLPMESVYNWTIYMTIAPTYKLRVGTGSGIGTAAIYKNSNLYGALEYYANFADITGFTTGDHYTITYTAMNGYVIDKYCDENINQCYINSGTPVTVQNIEGNIGFSNSSITIYAVQSLSIASLAVTEQAPYNVRVAVATTGKGTIAVAINGTESDFSQVTGSVLTTYDYVLNEGVTDICAYDKHDSANVISCRYININHSTGSTPTPTTPPNLGYHINVTTYPNGARFAWGGDDMGLTPVEFYTYGMNNYNISITKDGYQPYYESGVFTADRDINITLTPNGLPENRGTHLLIDSYPHGAKVFKNGDQYGTTPTEMYLYGMNQTTLVFKLDGYWDKTISGNYNQTTFINAILVSKSSSNPAPTPVNNPVPPTTPGSDENIIIKWIYNLGDLIFSIVGVLSGGNGAIGLVISFIIIGCAGWKWGEVPAIISFVALSAIGMIPLIWMLLGVFLIVAVYYLKGRSGNYARS